VPSLLKKGSEFIEIGLGLLILENRLKCPEIYEKN
jgi:hypothetical protein